MKVRNRRKTVTVYNAGRSPNPLRLDPTRTITLRRMFGVELRRRFARLGDDLYQAIVEQDILGIAGLSHNPLTNEFNPNQPRDSSGRWSDTGGGVSLKVSGRVHPLAKDQWPPIQLEDGSHADVWADITDNEFNPNQPRDNQGRWSEVGGGGAFVDEYLRSSRKGLHPEIAAKESISASRSRLDRVTSLPVLKQVRQASGFLKDQTSKLYNGLENRYGRKQAIAIMGSAQVLGWGALGAGALVGVPLYLPGVSIWGSLPAAALAETFLQAKKGAAKLKAAFSANEEQLTPEQIEEAAQQLVSDIARYYLQYLREQAHTIRLAYGDVTANTFDPNQPRDDSGRWSRSGGGDVSSKPYEGPDREIHHLGVNRVVQDTVSEWKYHAPVKVWDQNGPEFERGGIRWIEGGNCYLGTGLINIHSGTAGESVEAIRRLIVHEMMHGVWEHVYQTYEAERKRLEEPAPTKSGVKMRYDGSPYPEYVKEVPTYARIDKLFSSEGKTKKLISDDGVSDYSKAYWRDYEAGKVTFHIAVRETLAEIAAIHETTGKIEGSKIYQDLYKGIRDEYKVITGAQKTRKGPASRIVANQASHEMYLDRELRPTSPENALYIKIWGTDGTVSWGVRAGVTTNARDWQFHSDPQKIQEFKDWLRSQMSRRIANGPDDEIWRRYALAGYLKGAGRAFDDTRKVDKAIAESNAEKLPFYQGNREQFLRSALANPVGIDKVKLLAGRVYSDLEGVTEAMASSMTRILADGLVQGKSPKEIARDLSTAIDISKTRAEVIAQTEIIRAHAEGQLDALEAMGVQEVGVAVEWAVTKIGDQPDSKVCPQCRPLDGVVLTIDEARGMLPRHPRCRCAWIPANVGESGPQKATKRKIDIAITTSIGGREQRWGPAEPISKKRPDSILNEFSRFIMNDCGTGAGGFKPGNTCAKGGATYTPSVKIKPTKKRAFEGKQVAIKTKISKQYAGKLGEDIIIAYLQSKGLDDARPMNLDRNNFPVDLIQDSEVIEGKTGQAGNSPRAQQWRLTIGEPGKEEKAWLAKAGEDEKSAWNAKKQQMIHDRKGAVIKRLSDKLGRNIKVSTMAVIINPDTKTADLYKFPGFHDRIGWNSTQAKDGYIGSVTYE